ncbi:MAG: MBOAT family protein [Micropepsaceae bacterium]
MLFTEPFFLLFFLPVTLVLFYGCVRLFGREAGLWVLFATSCVFYANWGIGYFALMMAGTALNFVICYGLISWSDRPARFRILALGQIYNFGTLLYFKYFAYLAVFSDLDSHAKLQAAAIPIGISFYTFQQAVLLVDAYARSPVVTTYFSIAGRPPALSVATFARYGAFHCFFPQLVIGPIAYLSEVGPQFLRTAFGRFRRTDFEVGLSLIAIGLFKKVVVADNLGLLADPVFNAAAAGDAATQAQAWVGTLAYFAQLYFDFSGYSDIAIGIARLFGVRLPMNFDSPLRATGIVDFYRRWHITLTRVISRFLFTPLSLWGTRTAMAAGLRGSHFKFLAAWLPFLVNFEVIALWHGALPTFVLFGIIHGTWYVAEIEARATKTWRSFKAKTSEKTRRVLGQAFTFLPLMLTFALFRSETIGAFTTILEALFVGGNLGVLGVRAGLEDWALLTGAFAVIVLLPNSNELLRRYRPGIRTWENVDTTAHWFRFVWRPNPIWTFFIVTLIVVTLFQLNRDRPFIYLGF